MGALDGAWKDEVQILMKWLPDLAHVSTYMKDTLSVSEIQKAHVTTWNGNNMLAFLQIQTAMARDDLKGTQTHITDPLWAPFTSRENYESFQAHLKYAMFIPAAVCFGVLLFASVFLPYLRVYGNTSRAFSLSRALAKKRNDPRYLHTEDTLAHDRDVRAREHYIQESNKCIEEQNEQRRKGVEVTPTPVELYTHEDLVFETRKTKEQEELLTVSGRYESNTYRCVGGVLFIGELFALYFFFKTPDTMTSLVGDNNLMATLYLLAILALMAVGVCLMILGFLPADSYKFGEVQTQKTLWKRVPVPNIFDFLCAFMLNVVAIAVVYESAQMQDSGARTRYIIASLLFFTATWVNHMSWSYLFTCMRGDVGEFSLRRRTQTNTEDRHLRALAKCGRWFYATIASCLLCKPHTDVVYAFFHRRDGACWYFRPVWPVLWLLTIVLAGAACTLVIVRVVDTKLTAKQPTQANQKSHKQGSKKPHRSNTTNRCRSQRSRSREPANSAEPGRPRTRSLARWPSNSPSRSRSRSPSVSPSPSRVPSRMPSRTRSRSRSRLPSRTRSRSRSRSHSRSRHVGQAPRVSSGVKTEFYDSYGHQKSRSKRQQRHGHLEEYTNRMDDVPSEYSDDVEEHDSRQHRHPGHVSVANVTVPSIRKYGATSPVQDNAYTSDLSPNAVDSVPFAATESVDFSEDDAPVAFERDRAGKNQFQDEQEGSFMSEQIGTLSGLGLGSHIAPVRMTTSRGFVNPTPRPSGYNTRARGKTRR
jgi:hypothetical protein